MSTPIDTRVSSALHEGNVANVDGYSEETAPLLASTMEAFSDAYITIGKIFDARAAASANKAWTESQQVIHVADAAFKAQQRLLKKFDGLSATLDKQITHLEQELSTPLESKAVMSIAAEIRKHAKDMASDQRHHFLRHAIDEGDATTVSAILGAPSYLSGLDAKFAKTYTRLWHERMNPATATRLKAVRNAKALVDERVGLIMPQIEKAIGAPWSRINMVRQGNDKALAALKFGE